MDWISGSLGNITKYTAFMRLLVLLLVTQVRNNENVLIKSEIMTHHPTVHSTIMAFILVTVHLFE